MDSTNTIDSQDADNKDDTDKRKIVDDALHPAEVSKFQTDDLKYNPESKIDHNTCPQKRKCTCYVPRRYVTSFLTGLGMLLVYAMRTNIGLTAITLLDTSSPAKVEDAETVSDYLVHEYKRGVNYNIIINAERKHCLKYDGGTCSSGYQ
ncbi:hypothetical protein KP79_PYT18947 [Mizuhopecten yessoensis]|uniref:Uncharacterized protein n=1 Tax=Mizuhopecten yessoensis TaxID=6573 RepID=A0A210QZL8_MIZYE|nr:hypothetical protein KP79_PYT18947 [Mizuhopecten yessoensis]